LAQTSIAASERKWLLRKLRDC